MKIAVIGATGLVGRLMLKVLEERGFTGQEIFVAASPKSVGKMIKFAKRELMVQSVEDVIAEGCDFAVFSAGGTASKQYAPLFAELGTIVIDNSSAWRMDANVPLVVPEINVDAIKPHHRIIANPNCSTIQMVMALYPLYKAYGIRRVVVSTYQSVSGTGLKAVNQLKNEQQGMVTEKAYHYPIHENLIPHGGDFLPNGYTTEEEKLVNETRKILDAPHMCITATVVRVPVLGGHSESVNVEFEREFDLNEVKDLLRDTPGVVIIDEPEQNLYPMPLYAEGRDQVFVGRLRRDFSQPYSLNMWVVSDNLRKGAATNAIQILESIIG
ncbi:MAG: aspartate-semialdehyde dehydrogenase [Bacteroidales bacterium]|jgi:aspartate-semialdehyde dehydrogenase|nr:aspartate-semialdehyde dehydrogenase [Bacteroidales bacterium]